jgi:DNA-binding NtrC family response regulator
LSLHDWPGNVRELYNVMQRAVVSADGATIHGEDVGPSVAPGARVDPPHGSFRQARARAVETFERDFVEELMRRHGGNITRAAREAQKRSTRVRTPGQEVRPVAPRLVARRAGRRRIGPSSFCA